MLGPYVNPNRILRAADARRGLAAFSDRFGHTGDRDIQRLPLAQQLELAEGLVSGLCHLLADLDADRDESGDVHDFGFPADPAYILGRGLARFAVERDGVEGSHTAGLYGVSECPTVDELADRVAEVARGDAALAQQTSVRQVFG